MTKIDDLRPYKLFGLSLIQLMTIIAVLGIILTAVLVHYFPNFT